VPYLLAVDQSTSATKALIFDASGNLVDKTSIEHAQYYPEPGWVEHDAEEIWANTIEACRRLLEKNRPLVAELLCLSITNQRETIVVFEKRTGRPLYHAIVWQCRRGAPICDRLVQENRSEKVRQTTGLKIDTYFSASKLKWLFDHHPEIHQKLARGEALIGTIDAYLIYRLTKGKVHATDQTNASRTLLYDIGKLRWDEELCDLFNVPAEALPAVCESAARFGETDLGGLLAKPLPICGVMGDSQAALFAERCFTPGSTKVTFGTGSSVLLNLGPRLRLSDKGIVTTIGWVFRQETTYTFEGITNFTGAAVAWLKHQLKLIDDEKEAESIACSVPDNGGVYLVPAFVGLSAPYWAPNARAAFLGLTPHSTKAHVVRATLESIAYQIREVLDLMASEAGLPLQCVHADGGMVNNRFLMQFVADVTRRKVRASTLPELSALGAVLSGTLGMGLYGSVQELEQLPQGFVEYEPQADERAVEANFQGYRKAVQRVL
jgi:glycerol kinase